MRVFNLMEHNNRIKYVFLSSFLIVLVVLSYLFQHTYSPAPLLLWNRTESVPLGIYRKIQLKNIHAGQTIYASVSPDVLSNVSADTSVADQQKLLQLQHALNKRSVPLLKQMSLKNVNSIASKTPMQRQKLKCTDGTLKKTFYVISSHKDGIDSKIFGKINFEDILGFYVLIIRFN